MTEATEGKSKLPPRTIEHMRKLNTEALRLYANDLLSSYDARAMKLDKVGTRMREVWVVNQAAFLEAVANELRSIIASGTSP